MQMQVGNDWYDKKRSIGFTLLELLIVMLIMGVVLGAVGLSAAQTNKQVLQQDVQRLAALMQLARDEAIVKNRLIAVELDANRYRFFIKNDNGWQVLQDDVLRERIFKLSPIEFSLLNGVSHVSSWHLVFGRDPVDQPFVLALQYAQDTYSINADGIGHFRVE